MTTVAVIGLGRIGSRNDEAANPAPLSHVGAILATTGLRLAAMVDPDPGARNDAARLWQGRSDAPMLGDPAEIRPGSADAIAVCTPTKQRLADVEAALGKEPRLLIVEKPLGPDLATARRVAKLVQDAGVALLVNYNRRFDAQTREFAMRFPGPPRKAVLRYGKGLFNYASHMVDLMQCWFGPVGSVQATPAENLEGDPNIDFRCRFAAGFDAHFCGIDGIGYDQFDIDLFFPDRRLSYLSGGAERREWRPKADLCYSGYTHLSEDPDAAAFGQIGGFSELYAAVERHLAGGAPLEGCDGAAAVRVQAVLDSVVRSAANAGRAINVAEDILDQEA